MSRVANNFDLVRLLAALQVALWHSVTHLKATELLWVKELLGVFPGVPIFFVVSGYLVSGSLARAPTLKAYFANRFLRLYPGLWLCTAFSVVALSLFGRFEGDGWKVAVWLLGELGFGHGNFFGLFREYGTGSVNGSLWTISVELQFYLLLPVFVWFLKGRQSWWQWVLFGATLLCGIGYLYLRSLYGSRGWMAGVALLSPSWVYMFFLGFLLQRHPRFVDRFLRGRFFAWLGFYLVVAVVMASLGFKTVGNVANPVSTCVLGLMAVSAAYSFPGLAHRLLRGNDISYGLYIFHMPVINVFVETGMLTSPMRVPAALIASIVISMLSWRFVERPCLALKPVSIHPQPAS